MDRSDAREQLRVERDLVVRGGDLRRPLLVDCLGLRRAQVVREDREQRLGAVRVAAGVLERHEGVLERRRLGVLGDHVDLGEHEREPGLEGLSKPGDVQLVPRRHATVRSGPGHEQRVLVRDRGQPGDLGGRGIARGRWGRRGAAPPRPVRPAGSPAEPSGRPRSVPGRRRRRGRARARLVAFMNDQFRDDQRTLPRAARDRLSAPFGRRYSCESEATTRSDRSVRPRRPSPRAADLDRRAGGKGGPRRTPRRTSTRLAPTPARCRSKCAKARGCPSTFPPTARPCSSTSWATSTPCRSPEETRARSPADRATTTTPASRPTARRSRSRATAAEWRTCGSSTPTERTRAR